MNTTDDTIEIAAQLVSLHNNARNAFLDRDLNAYRDCFTDDLQYTQIDGITITRDQLMRDVAPQLRQFKTVESEYVRDSMKVNDDGSVSQFLEQTGSYSVSIFFFFTKKWTFVRYGEYTYRETVDGWRVCAVKVLKESIS